jgi:carboxymethylenebutenolidase
VINPKLQRHADRLSGGQRYIIHEFVEDYREGALSRRDLLERVFRITGSTAATAGVLLTYGLRPAFADALAATNEAPPAQTGPMSPFSVPEGDPAVATSAVTYPNGGDTIQAYLARPSGAGRYPAVMICHDNGGITDHFRDVARRYAKSGYVGLVVDLLSRRGGTAAVPTNEISPYLFEPANILVWVSDFQAAMAYLRRQPFVLPERIGMTGFCFGGGVTWDVAIKEPSLRAAAPYYGPTNFLEEVASVRAAVLGVYAENDNFVNPQLDQIREGLARGRVTSRVTIYPDARHAFFNDTRPNDYHEAASTAAWRDTLAWFNTYLRVGVLPGTGDGGGAAPEADGVGEPAAEAAPAQSAPESAE